MRYCVLGQTGLSVSVVGFGASPLGGVFGKVTPKQGEAAVHRALDRGINLFDVSPYYGLSLAEEQLGGALLGRRHEVVLATKCGRYGVDRFDFSPQTVVREFDSSLRRLRTDYVDLLQVHDTEFGSFDQIVQETLPALRDLQQQGKTRFVGITGYWPNLLARIAQTASVDSVLNYCHSNLLMNDMDGELTPVAERLGIGLMNASPLHMGLLSGSDVPSWHPAPTAVRVAAQKVMSLCRDYSINPAILGLNACLRHSAVASTFIGLSSIAEVDQSLAALDFDPPPGLMRAISDCIRPVFNTVWPSGLAENQPAGILHAH